MNIEQLLWIMILMQVALLVMGFHLKSLKSKSANPQNLVLSNDEQQSLHKLMHDHMELQREHKQMEQEYESDKSLLTAIQKENRELVERCEQLKSSILLAQKVQ